MCTHTHTQSSPQLGQWIYLLNSLSEMLSHTYYSHYAKILWWLYLTIRTELIVGLH